MFGLLHFLVLADDVLPAGGVDLRITEEEDRGHKYGLEMCKFITYD